MSEEIHFLVLQCKKGNQRAQIKLYERYCKAMFFVSFRYLKNEEAAKDTMQEAFLKAFLNLEAYKENIRFGSWLKKIVINTCIDALRKKNLTTVSIENDLIEIIDDEDWSCQVEISKEQIIAAIETLKIKYQLVLKLYLIEGYDHSEISEILEIPIKISRTQLRRGKSALQKILKAQKYGT